MGRKASSKLDQIERDLGNIYLYDVVCYDPIHDNFYSDRFNIVDYKVENGALHLFHHRFRINHTTGDYQLYREICATYASGEWVKITLYENEIAIISLEDLGEPRINNV